MRSGGVENIISNYKETIGRIGEYFRNMDEKYYGELEGRPEDMKDLTQFLDKTKI